MFVFAGVHAPVGIHAEARGQPQTLSTLFSMIGSLTGHRGLAGWPKWDYLGTHNTPAFVWVLGIKLKPLHLQGKQILQISYLFSVR